LTFNAEASRALHAADLRRVRLFGDLRSKRVVIRPAPASPTEGADTHLISYQKTTPTQIRATIEAKPFLCWLGYSFAPPESQASPNTTASDRRTGATRAVQRYELHSLPRRSFTFTLDAPEPSTPDHSEEATA
jgi:hypothetical protein